MQKTNENERMFNCFVVVVVTKQSRKQTLERKKKKERKQERKTEKKEDEKQLITQALPCLLQINSSDFIVY